MIEPRILTPEEVAKRYPAVAVVVLKNGEAHRVHGQIVARTVTGQPRYDVRTRDGDLLRDIESERVIDLATGRTVQ